MVQALVLWARSFVPDFGWRRGIHSAPRLFVTSQPCHFLGCWEHDSIWESPRLPSSLWMAPPTQTSLLEIYNNAWNPSNDLHETSLSRYCATHQSTRGANQCFWTPLRHLPCPHLPLPNLRSWTTHVNQLRIIQICILKLKLQINVLNPTNNQH